MFTRVVFFVIGLFVLSLGIATVTHAGLGTGTVSSAAIVLSKWTGLSLGFFVFATNLFFFVLQCAVDTKGILIKALKQIPVIALFGVIFDVAMWLTSPFDPQTYWGAFIQVIVGTALTGLGISCMVFARLLILPPEGLVIAIMRRWGGSFGTIRMVVDVFLILAAVSISFCVFGTVVGIREGTLVTALGSGRCANVFLKVWGRLFPQHRVVD